MTLVIADTGALISLGHLHLIPLLEKIFGEFHIAEAVWVELLNYENPNFDSSILEKLKNKVVKIESQNHLKTIMDLGESESVILYGEMGADFLLIDDQKARVIAESLNVNCIGSIGVLIKAKRKGLIPELRPHFEKWISEGRYFSIRLLNNILTEEGEGLISRGSSDT